MNLPTYKIEISTDGTIFTEITNSVIRESIEFTYSLHDEGDIKSTSNTARFRLKGNDSYLAQLTSIEKPLFCRIYQNSSMLIEGVIAPSLDVTTDSNGVESISLTVEDYTLLKLKKSFTDDVNYSSYYVSNPQDVSHSILHLIVAMANVGVSSYPTILDIVPYFSYSKDDTDTYFDILDKLLYECGYTFYFNKSGLLSFYNFASAPTDKSTIANVLRNDVNQTSNIRKRLTTNLKRGAYDFVKLTWCGKELKSDIVVYEVTDGAKDGYSCYIPLEAHANYPPEGDNGFVTQSYDNTTYKILNVVSANFQYLGTSIVLSEPFVNYGKKCHYLINNPNSYTGYITKLKATGQAWVEGSKGITTVEIHNTVKNKLEYECSFLYTEEQAKRLSIILKNFYAFSKVSYETTSYDYFDIGEYIKVIDNIHQGFTGYGRIRKIIFNSNGSYTYTIESISDYENTDTSTTEYSSELNKNIITQAILQSGTVPSSFSSIVTRAISASSGTLTDVTVSGTIAGMIADLDKLYIGEGTYNNANTPFYVNSVGQVSFGNKLVFNGSNLTINGGGTFSGALSAASGTFAGSLSGATGTFSGTVSAGSVLGGTISIGSGNSIFKADSNGIYLGNATFASAPFRVTPDGVLTATSATISGSSTFAGSLSGATGTFSGTVSSGSFVGGTISIGSGNSVFKADSNGIYLGNASFASAPFTVTSAGALTATGATISGNITATTITANNGGTIAGWITDSDSFKSASSGARVQLTKSLNRLSIYSSTDEEVVVGYISGKRKNGKEWDATKTYAIGDLASRSGEVYKCTVANTNQQPPNTSYWSVSTDTWGSTDRGIWVNPATTCQIDGILESKNGSLIATDGSLKVKRGTTEILRLGTVNGFDGMTMFNNNGANPVIISNNNFSGTTIDSAGIDVICYNGSTLSGYISYGIETTDNHVTHNAFLGSTTQKLTIHDALTVDTSATISNNLNVGLTSTLGTKMQLNGGNVVLDTASTKLAIPTLSPTSYSGIYALITQDTGGTVTVKKQLVPDAVWSFSCNQDVSTSGAPTFASVSANAFWENGSRLLSASGTAAAATKLQTARRITAGGDCTGYIDFDGSADVTIPIQITTDSHYHTAATISGAQSGNTPNSIVMRGASGEFGAGNVTTTGLTVNGSVQVNGNIGCTGTVDGVDLSTLVSYITANGIAFPAPTQYALSSSSIAINDSRCVRLTGDVTADIYINLNAPASGIYQYVIVNEAYSSTGKKTTLSCGTASKPFYLPTTSTPSILIVYTMTDKILIPISRYS